MDRLKMCKKLEIINPTLKKAKGPDNIKDDLQETDNSINHQIFMFYCCSQCYYHNFLNAITNISNEIISNYTQLQIYMQYLSA